ncbi:cadherin-like beta sandwich domain-containing protein [Bacillus xiapuensis]|uniref:Cadherin-like beta sandwich domain-containing protein n=1 Tax=Bacillus xiapuensis TaxID=2014075 RepID=A0ABU6NAZ0_9BACI|nr:cadherin-like beta sandwich domain-containing protein [Bacillus xiapuensis]
MRSREGVKIILATSLVSIGSISYIPSTYAATTDQTTVTTGQTTVTTISEEQNNNTLSKLEINGVSINPSFSSDRKEYSAIVENDIQQISLKLVSDNPKASISINGQLAGDKPLALKTGTNLFAISVSDGTYPQNTYTLTVTRKQNNNNQLKNIKLSNGELSPKFDSAILNYNIKVPYETASLKIMPEAMEETSTMQINNKMYEDGGFSVKLPVGESKVSILVTAENGEKKIYTLNVSRVSKNANNRPNRTTGQIPRTTGTKRNNSNWRTKPGKQTQLFTSNNAVKSAASAQNNGYKNQSQNVVKKVSKATLSSLSVSAGTWNKDFSSEEYTYHLTVNSDVHSVTISPNAKYSSSTINIEGGSSEKIKLDDKKTIISVVVTNGEDRKTYVLVFKKKTEKDESSSKQDNTSDVTASNSDNISVVNTSNTQSLPQTTVGNKSNSSQSTTLWGRITESISYFFNKLF